MFRKRVVFLLIFFLFYGFVFSQNQDKVSFGQNLIYTNKLDEAVEFYTNQLATKNSDEQKILFLFGLADVYKLKLEYDKTNLYLNKVHSEIVRTGNVQLEFLYHVKMMEFFRKRGFYLEAIRHQEKAESLLKRNHINDSYLSSYYSRRASIFSQHFGIQDSILKYANKSLKLAKKVNHKENVFYSTLEIADVYYLRKDFKTAIDYFEYLIEYAKQNNLIQHRADVYINYTNTLIKENKLEKALNESLKALDFIKKNDLLYNEIVITTTIYETYKKLGNADEAYNYLLKFIMLTDEYNLKKHNRFLFELEEKYKLAEKENEIKISALVIANKNKALASNKTKLFISIGLLLAALIVVLLILYFLKKSRVNNKKLQLLSQENEFLLSEANHRINNNLQLVIILISDQLKKTKGQESMHLKNILTKVDTISTLHKHLYKNNDKKKIDSANYLKDVTSSFFEVFKEKEIKTNFSISSIEITIDYAMYLGLLITELFINSVKHAFENQEYKEINLSVRAIGDTLYFDYSDNGTLSSKTNIEPKLIKVLCRQLKIDYTINTSNGFIFSFKQKINNE